MKWLLTVLTLLLCISPCRANGTVEMKSLQGLQGVLLVVEPEDASWKSIGLTEQKILDIVKPKLLKAGIKLVTNDEYQKDTDDAYALLDVSATVGKKTGVFDVELYLTQEVLLHRGNKMFASMGITWTSGYYGKDPSLILSGLDSRTQLFIDDYFKANPKQTTTQ